MAFKWSIPSLMVARYKAFEYDADAQAFFDATGITDSTIKSAVNTLVLAFKSSGAWTACIAIYPFVGGTADTHKYNLKNPQDTDAAFRLSFIDNGGTLTHAATGVKASNTGGAYANTFINPDPDTTLNSFHMSFYSRDDNAEANEVAMGCATGSNIIQSIIQRNADDFYSILYTVITTWIAGTNTDGRGLTMSSRTSSTSHSVYRNGSSIGSNAAAEPGGRPTDDFYLFGYNGSGVFSGGTVKECAFSTIGAGIDSTLAATMYTDIQNYQTALARQVT